MKSKYLGLSLILIGFATPFALRSVFPAFLYASVISTLCFWTGFLLVLHPIDSNHKFNPYLKWARYAILLNIILTVLLLGDFYLMFYLDIRRGLGFQLMRFLSFITNPIRSIFDQIVALPMEQQGDGSVHVTYSFIRSLFTDLFNLVFYSISGITAKFMKEKKITKLLQPIAKRAD